jgi:multiple sugar transport system substrate-binding protein
MSLAFAQLKRRSAAAGIAAAVAVSTTAFAQAPVEVRWAQWKTTEVGEKFMTEVKTAFEKDNPGIKLVLVDSPFTGFHDRALVQHQAKKLADVLMVQVDWIAEFADLGMLEPLDPFIAKEPKEFFAGIPTTFHQPWRGKQYYLPLETGSVALLYNTKIFKAAGIAGPPKTWDEFAEIARKVTKPEAKIFATTATLATEPPTNMTYDIYPLILQAGGKIIDSATNKAVFNSPEGVKAIEWYVDRVNKDKVAAPGILSNGEKEKRANFASGNIAMMFEGPWGISIQKQLNPALEFDIAPLPTNATNGTMVRGSMNTVTTQSANKEAAWKFMRWMSGPVGANMWSKGTGAFPARSDVTQQDWFKERKEVQAFVQQVGWQNAQSPFLGMPNAVQMNKIMTTEIQNVVQGKKTAKQALDDAAVEWDKIFAAASK